MNDSRRGAGSQGDERRRAHRIYPVFGALFLVMALFVVEDIVADVIAGHGGLHMALESVSLAVAIVGLGAATREYYGMIRRAEQLQGDLQRTKADVERWRHEAESLLDRLGSALDERFEAWALTDAEREITVHVLKGLSYKEIASARGTSERTVRHQALTIYRKAGVAGRAEMAGLFLDVMLSPVQRADDEDPDHREPARPAAAARVRA